MLSAMKHPGIIPCICGLLLVAALFAAGCTLTSGGKVTPTSVPSPVLTTVTAATPVSSTCGFTTCHGSDLACGTNAPDVCTMEYRIGDRCRQYARCDTSGGSCTLVISPKFTACKACAERCQIQAGPDSLAAFSCEEKC
jgi:hypothetical protein